MNFGEKLKVVRQALGLSQQELATRLGTTKQAVSRYENSDREPNLKTAKAFSEKLGIDLTLLADDEVCFPVADRIRQERCRQGYGKERFANLLGISEERLSSLECGREYPTVIELSRLCKLLYCSSDWLLNLEWRIENNVPAMNDEEAKVVLQYRHIVNSGSLQTLQAIYSAVENLNKKGREKLLGYADDLVSSGKYEKGKTESAAG